MTTWEDPHFVPPGVLLKLLVTDGEETWEPEHLYVFDGPSGQFFPHRVDTPISSTLTVIGWRRALH